MSAWGEAIFVVKKLTNAINVTNQAAQEIVTEVGQLYSDMEDAIDQLNSDTQASLATLDTNTQSSLNDIKQQATSDMSDLTDSVEQKVDDSLSEVTEALSNFQDIVISTMPIVANNLGTASNPNPGLEYTPYAGTQWFVTKDNN